MKSRKEKLENAGNLFCTGFPNSPQCCDVKMTEIVAVAVAVAKTNARRIIYTTLLILFVCGTNAINLMCLFQIICNNFNTLFEEISPNIACNSQQTTTTTILQC